MRRSITLPLLAALFVSSCSTVGNLRRDIEKMSPPEYNQLKVKIVSIAEIASNRVAQNWSDERKTKALSVINNGIAFVNDPSKLKQLDATNLIRALANRYSDQMGLSTQARSDILDVALLIDILVGPVKIDVDTEPSEREKGILLALLHGFGNGIIR